jgi:histidinol phosphatase-like enzyme
MAMRARAVFLDKDGTLIENVPYNVDPKRVVLTRGAGAALRDHGQGQYTQSQRRQQSG